MSPWIFIARLSMISALPLVLAALDPQKLLGVGLVLGQGRFAFERHVLVVGPHGIGRRNEFGPAPSQSGIVVTLVEVGGLRLRSMISRSTPDIRLDTRATA